VSLGADDTLTLAVSLGNRSSVEETESVQFFLTTPTASNELNISEFGDGEPTRVSVSNGSSWQTYHDLPSSWSNSTFTTSISMSDLQNALAASVRPVIDVSARSYVGALPNVTPTQVDAVPDTGYLPLSTLPPTTTTTATVPTPAPPTTTPPTATVSSAKHPDLEPFWKMKIVRLPHARIEWTRLSFSRIAAGTRVSVVCTKGCKLSEHPPVSHGAAVPKSFVNHPFSHGQVFMTKFIQPNGAGWWSQITIVAKPGGQEIATKDGCYLTDGTSLPFGKC
jgi:hypothetical protein